MVDISALWEPCPIGRRTAPNRLAAQPMEANAAGPRGEVSELNLKKYSDLARGGWGLVFLESVSVSSTSLAARRGMVLNRANLEGYKRLISGFKEIDPQGLLLVQLTHSGIRSGSFSEVTAVYPGQSPSARVLGQEEIEAVRRSFVEGTLLCREAGADGVDFKLCHGYLTTELLRPANTRPDRWGGSLENRTRFFREGLEEIKGRLTGRDFLLGSRISMYEGLRGGCGTAGPGELIEDLTETEALIGLMKDLGLDYVNVSAGLPGLKTELAIPSRPAALLHLDHFRYAKRVKELGSGMAVVGSAYSVLGEEGPGLAAENVAKGYVDLAGFGRQSLADPLYPKKLKAGEEPDFCRACLGCGRLYEADRPSGCLVYDGYFRKLGRGLKKE